ncbi:MAG: hypothetical protein SFU56_15675, partial [Capsulimonadales bacterium]|nr:hypothetical protein [Capsulimonadales bacterium]
MSFPSVGVPRSLRVRHVLSSGLAVLFLSTALAPARAQKPSPVPSPSVGQFSSVKQLSARIRAIKAQRKREKSKKPGTGYLEALLWYTRLRAFPNDTIDGAAVRRAAAARARMPVATLGGLPSGPNGPITNAAGAVTGTRWEFVGPRSLPVPYVIYFGAANSTVTGRINDVAYAPSQPSIVYLAAAGGGVWKSVNGGVNWSPLGDSFDFLYASRVAIDPNDPNTVYVGQGDFDGFQGIGYGGGIMKSTDGGITWTKLGGAELATMSVSGIVIDPENPQIITVSAGRNPNGVGYLYRSTNGGSTWVRASVPSIPSGQYGSWCDIKAGERNASTGVRYYYATCHFSFWNTIPGLYRSSDRGATWTKLTTAGTTQNRWDSLYRVAPSAIDPNTLYFIRGEVGSGGYTGSIYRGVRNSTTDTYTWTDIKGNFPTGSSNYNWSQQWYDLHIEAARATVNGQPTDILYAGAITLAASVGGNGTWSDIGRTYQSNAITHNDQHCGAFNPSNPLTGLIGNDGGLYGVTFNPVNQTWTIDSGRNVSLGLTQFYHADWHPSDPSRMLGGTQDNATP